MKAFFLIAIIVTTTIFNGISYGKNTQLDTVWINVAFECCDCGIDKTKNKLDRQYSFCSDGFEQLFGPPVFVQLNLRNFTKSYERPVYCLICDVDNSRKKDLDMLDSLEKMVGSYNTVSFYNGKFKRAVNRQMKRINKSMADFDGKFYYGLFRLRVVRENIGYINKTLPILGFLDKTNEIDRKVTAYYIVDILNIEPINKNEYLKGINIR